MNDKRLADRTKCSVYIISLAAGTSSRKQREASEKLRALHPSGLEGKRIALRKNKRTKDEYICVVYPDYFEKPLFTTFLAAESVKKNFSGTIVFKTKKFSERMDFSNGSLKKSSLISEEDSQKLAAPVVLSPENSIFFQKKLLRSIVGISLLICTIMSALYFHKLSSIHAENARIQKEVAEQKKKQLQAKAEKEKFLEGLVKNHADLHKDSTASPYEITSIIYRNIHENAKIKNLSITGNDFVIEAESKDGTAILASFEKDGNVTNAGLQHIFWENGKDLFILTGTAVLPNEEPSPALSTEEKIKFYLEKNEEAAIRQNTTISHSQYTDDLRKLLRNCSLEASSIQNMYSNEETQSEYTVRGSVQSFINFLYQAKEKNIVFANLRLQQQEHEATASFRIKLPPTGENKNEPSQPPEFSPKEIAGTFATSDRKKTPSPRISASEKTVPTETKAETKTANFLTYIGQVKVSGMTTAYIKNNRNGEIIKVPYTSDGKLYVTVNSETYEVKQ